jgi:hypothetical protein
MTSPGSTRYPRGKLDGRSISPRLIQQPQHLALCLAGSAAQVLATSPPERSLCTPRDRVTMQRGAGSINHILSSYYQFTFFEAPTMKLTALNGAHLCYLFIGGES